MKLLLLPVISLISPAVGANSEANWGPFDPQAQEWRAERRLIDLHGHIAYQPETLARAVRIMDAAGVGLVVNLSGGTTIPQENGTVSAFQTNKQLADELHPGRFLHYMNLDYSRWNEPDFTEHAVRQVEEGHRLGAAGLKEFKRLGLTLRDAEGNVIMPDDPKLDPVWKRCGELGMPVSIHVADPRAFWLPFDPSNERWTELKDHRDWWFGDPEKYPSREELLASLNRVIERNPKTTFVCVHFANNAEDLDWVEESLDAYPNMMADLAARVPEIGRHDPDKVRRLFLKHADRILFATDFIVRDKLVLGSGGEGPPPTDADAVTFYRKHWRWLETNDRDWEHMTPIQGDWNIHSIGLPAEVLRKIYFDNARKLLRRSLPKPIMKASRIEIDFEPNGRLERPYWRRTEPVRLAYTSRTGEARPELATTVRALWSDQYLYLGYECPYTQLTVFEPARKDQERRGLWERDVVEAFIGPEALIPSHYYEFEVAPTGEKLDLQPPVGTNKLAWNSGFLAETHINEAERVWTAVMRIPLAALSADSPQSGTRWALNLYRKDTAGEAFLALHPTLGNAHVPERFAWLEFTR